MLRESTGNMYSFITHTWNPIKGKCPHDCSYCYMKRWGKQKPLRLDENEMKTDLGSGNFIFVGSSTDMFAKAVPRLWIKKVLNKCGQAYQGGYLFQSKNPSRFIDFLGMYPSNAIFCTTIETNRWYPEIMNNAPSPSERSDAMFKWPYPKYVTIEPILDFDLKPMVELIRYCNPIQVNIGADSGNNHLPEPSKDQVLALIAELKKFTVVHRKINLGRLA